MTHVYRPFGLALVIFLVYPLSTSAQNWKLLGEFPGFERDDGLCLFSGAKAYCGFGAAPWATLSDFFEYRPDADVWSRVASLPDSLHRQYLTGFVHDSKVWIFGGSDDSNKYYRDLWNYDPQTGRWAYFSDLPAAPRAGMASFQIQAAAYFLGGRSSESNHLNELWVLDLLTLEWKSKSRPPFSAEFRSAAVTLEDRAYVFGGRDAQGRLSDTLWSYEADQDRWMMESIFPGGKRVYASMYASKNGVYILGGMDEGGTFFSDFWFYNLHTQSWVQRQSIPEPATRGGLYFQNKNEFYYLCGLSATGQRSRQVWKYTEMETAQVDVSKPSIQIFPQPAFDWISVSFLRDDLNQIQKIRILDVWGRCRYQYAETNLLEKIHLNSLETGMYFLELRTPEIVLFHKFMVHQP